MARLFGDKNLDEEAADSCRRTEGQVSVRRGTADENATKQEKWRMAGAGEESVGGKAMDERCRTESRQKRSGGRKRCIGENRRSITMISVLYFTKTRR